MEQEKYICENCNEAEFDTPQQLRGHQMRCRPKDESKNIEESRHGRKERIPFGVPVARFNAPEDDGFVYRVFNANWRKEPGRIERAKMAGYEVVEHPRSGESVGTNDDGSEIKGVLMRIPKELYDEDQAAKQREIDKVDKQIYRGEFKKGVNDRRYLPGGGITTETKLTP